MKKFLLFILTVFILFQNAYAMNVFDKRGKTVVIMYHKLSENSNEWNNYCISPKTFEDDIVYLKKSGYEFLTASQLAQTDTKKRKIAVITFDDGYYSDYEYAVPILNKHSASATFFVFGGAVGTDGYMSADNIKEISQNALAEIGNHSYALHQNTPSALSILYGSGKNVSQIADDYNKNAVFLKEITGKEITALSYPNGIYSDEVDKAVKSSGVKITFSTKPYSYSSINIANPVGRKTRSAFVKIENLVK